MNLHRRPLFPFTIAYIAGIVCAVEANLHPTSGLGIGTGIFFVGLALPRKLLPRPVLALISAVFIVGFLRSSTQRLVPANDISRYAEGKLVYVTGVVRSDPEPRAEGVRFVVHAEKVETYTGEYPVSGRAMVTLYPPRWQTAADEDSRAAQRFLPFYGDTVRIYGRLREPPPPSNPGAPSYAAYLARQRVFCVISGATDDVKLVQRSGKGIGRAAAGFKARLRDRVYKHFPRVEGSLLLGVLLGNYAALPPDVQSAFMRTGTIHLLAASGYNCGVIILIFGFILRRLTVPRGVTHTLLMLLLWGFALVAGPGPSIVRATIMVTVFLAAYLLWRAPDMVNTVLLAALIITGVNPLSLYDAGFQLSFAAVIAIVLVLPLVEPKVAWLFTPERGPRPGLPIRGVLWLERTIVLALLLSVAASLGTAPITAYYFNYLSLVSVVANALVALLVILLTAAGLASVVLSYVAVPAGAFAGVVGTGIADCMLGIVTELGRYPWSSFSVRSPSTGFMLLYYVAFLGALEYAHRRTACKRR